MIMFKVGDKVNIKNLTQTGVIVEIRKDKFKIELDGGFGFWVVQKNQISLVEK